MHSAQTSAREKIRTSPCLLFAYHEMGHACMTALLELGAPVAALFTHEDNPNEKIWWSSCAGLARGRGIPVFTPEKIENPWLKRIETLGAAVIYSFNYRSLLPAEVLRLAPLGAYNLHPSLLPAYRGRVPVNWVLVNGESRTGVTLHHMIERPDAGDIVAQRAIAIGDDDNALTLFRKLVPIGVGLVREMHPLLVSGSAPRIPQDISKGSYFGRRRPEDGAIDWHWPARRIFNLVRAVTHPYPGAFSFIGGRKLFIWRARIHDDGARGGDPGTVIGLCADGTAIVAAGAGSLRLDRIQIEGEAEGIACQVLARARTGDVIKLG